MLAIVSARAALVSRDEEKADCAQSPPVCVTRFASLLGAMAPTIEEVLAFLDHTGLSQTREVLLHELHDYGLDASSASLTGVVGEGPPSAGADIDSQTG